MTSTTPHEAQLFDQVERIVDAAREQVARSVNTAMVHAYWLIGREVVETEQLGEARAQYGTELINRLAERLSARFGKGFSARTLRRIRLFYLTYPDGSPCTAALNIDAIWPTLLSNSGSDAIWTALLSKSSGTAPRLIFPPTLSWSHYLLLIKIENEQARAFYEIEAVRENWSTRQLDRQIAALLYERLARSRDASGVKALAQEGLQVRSAQNVIKDPMVLEFLDLDEQPHWQERDLEQAIIERLETFLLEMGKGFCFVGRQKRISLEGDHFYVDLVFYNRLLRSFILLDLKLGKLTHQDIGQMQMYVNLFDHSEREDGDAPTIGIVLCSDKNDAMVRITLPENSQVHASRYQLYLPSEEELSAEIERERVSAELALRIESGGS